MDDEGYMGSIRNGVMKFSKGSLIVARARKTNTSYLVHTWLCLNEVNVATDKTSELRHKRLCHMSEKGMRKLVTDDLIPEVKNVHLDKCADCLAGKQNRTSFRSRPPMRRKALLELVHTDVCSVDMKSHSGGQYFVTFIDNHSRKLWAYMLKTKDQVRVEREIGRKLKAAWADNGGEYQGQFEEYYRSKGIRLEYTVAKMPEPNGLAERMNQTIMERVWSMLAHAKLSKMFQGEALMTTLYVINRSPLVPLDGDIPQRVWTGKDVSYRHLRVFGCLSYMHVSKD